MQKPNDHLNGSGCPKCVGKNVTTNEFIINGKKIHGNKYDYSLVNYINGKTKVKIICNKHGIFEQIPATHSNGHGCPSCCESHGERNIRVFLEKNNVKYIKEKKFNKCKNKKLLSFDFYLPDLNTLIEFDGIQHFKPINHFGGIKAFNMLKYNDNLKNIFANQNQYKLIRISYNENINEKLLESKII